ncbi:MAG: RES family NAD+ phosphorylase [Qingshengfaniella sp.]
MPLTNGRYAGPLYRALNPAYARDPLSGHGAERHGGRFNPRGMPALYTATDPATAVREANQAGSLQPTVLVSYRADLGPVFDTRDTVQLTRHEQTAQTLADPGWRLTMLAGHTAPTQDLARTLIADSFVGLLVRSFAKGAAANSLNLVLWRWTGTAGTLAVIDDENRLGRM